jgi:hypothetical protein
MSEMDIDKVAQRAAKRKNNKIAKRYPLFADQFATTPEAEKERILRQRARAEVAIHQSKERSWEKWKEGIRLREIARRLLSDDAFKEQDSLWQRFHKYRVPEYDGHILADFWFNALKGTDWAIENCPNRNRHNDPDWWRPRFHNVYQKFVETTECPTCGMKKPVEVGDEQVCHA